MFRTILVPTDGSGLADQPLQAAMELARGAGGRIVALSVAEPYPFSPLSEMPYTSDAEKFEAQARERAEASVKTLAEAAAKEGVACETIVAQSDDPAHEIVGTAREKQCDAIFMASHGRKGIKRIFVGSQTQKVLAQSPVPVMVFR